MKVEPLTRDEVRELIKARLNAQTLQEEIVDSICRRTAGNALYCVELISTMMQRKVLEVRNDRNGNKECVLSPGVEDLDAVNLPNSLHATMSSQLDRMEPSIVAVLKAASVVGMQWQRRRRRRRRRRLPNPGALGPAGPGTTPYPLELWTE